MTQNKKNISEQEQSAHEGDLYKQVETFFLANRNAIVGVFAVLVIAIGGYFGYKKLIQEPKDLDARSKIAAAQIYFEKDSLNLALNGDGINPGFLAITSSYKNTATGNLANYYTGLIYLKQQNIDEAIKYLDKYKPGTPELEGLTNRLLGDAWSEKGEMDKAVNYYKSAGKAANSDFFSPTYYKMAGDLLLMQEKYAEAIAVFEIIQQEYPLSEEGQNIQKEIAYASAKLGK